MEWIKNFVRNEIVLCVAFILALISSFIIRPSKEYIGYIDFRTLSILLSLMITMAGFQKLSVFRQIGEHLVARTNSIRGIVIILLMLCFFSSMFITNDVALLTFVPFSIVTLSISGRKDLLVLVIVLETLAANLGSMLIPLGNPQNLFLYSLSGMTILEFIGLMLPYSVLSLVLLLLSANIFLKKSQSVNVDIKPSIYKRSKMEKLQILIYIFTFILSLLVVIGYLKYYIVLAIIVGLTLVFDRRVLRKPDYSLLFTFIFLFIFIGNIKSIPLVSNVLVEIIKENEVGVSILLSQFISNVPAAILTAGFTENISKIIIGTNLGGLGTLIASMASLISFKQYSYIEGATVKRYVKMFTTFNIVFLILLLIEHNVIVMIV